MTKSDRTQTFKECSGSLMMSYYLFIYFCSCRLFLTRATRVYRSLTRMQPSRCPLPSLTISNLDREIKRGSSLIFSARKNFFRYRFHCLSPCVQGIGKNFIIPHGGNCLAQWSRHKKKKKTPHKNNLGHQTPAKFKNS